MYTGRESLRPSLMTDLYQLTMAGGYFLSRKNEEVTFELFIRSLPPNRSYFVAAGLEQAVEFLRNLRFDRGDVTFLKGLPALAHLPDEFFTFLSRFRFEGDLWGVPEGTLVFPNEPILQVLAPLPQAQLVETFLLSVIHFQTLVATKASRVVQAAGGRGVIDFGTRRAHGPEAGVLAARASFIGGCIGTSNVCAAKEFGIPVYGTAAHSWTLAFDSEQEAFERYHAAFPESTTLLIDTYDTLEGLRNALRLGPKLRGVRLDSGDLLQLSREARRILDEAGLRETRILASGDLNEYKVQALVQASAPVDLFGVGTEMVTSKDQPALGAVYKLVERRDPTRLVYCAKFSEEKETFPGRKQVWRTMSDQGTYVRDEICSAEEERTGLSHGLLVPILERGEPVYTFPPLEGIRAWARDGLESLPDDFRRLEGADTYPVAFSSTLRQRVAEMRGTSGLRPPSASKGSSDQSL
jgi:nicotinate phosphoribosyltransferase